jgi:hypothetical protein
MIDSVGGRKAAACLTALLIAVGAFLIKGDLPEGLADMIKYIVTTYIAGNIGADVIASVGARKATQIETTTAPEAIREAISADTSEALTRIEEGQKQLGAGIKVCQDGLSYIVSQMGRPANKG